MLVFKIFAIKCLAVNVDERVAELAEEFSIEYVGH